MTWLIIFKIQIELLFGIKLVSIILKLSGTRPKMLFFLLIYLLEYINLYVQES